MKSTRETVVLGSGFAGLTAAIRLAEEGHRVRCWGDGTPGASLQNFGQLHSGAVYAPVLPEVSAACWEHRSRWFDLLGPDVQRIPGRALFADESEVDRYTQAWSDIAIPVRRLPVAELDGCGTRPAVAPKAVFALPDISVDVSALHARTISRAESLGVTFGNAEPCTLTRCGTEAMLWSPSAGYCQPRTVVLAAGHRAVHLLDLLGVQHPLTLQRLPFGVLEHAQHGLPLTYWLDGDLLAVSPQPLSDSLD
ncbi:FAD-dependent oxidoreductase [Streptacidiphilus sp. PAMC 29251]